MSRLNCWFIDDAAEYETTQAWSGPCYVFIFEYQKPLGESAYVAQFLSEKLLTSVGNLGFNLIVEAVEEKTGVMDLTTEEVREAFSRTRPVSEYSAGDENAK